MYNVEEYIIQCLESLAMQTFKDFEVIIVNDGTKDRSAELAAEFIEARKLDHFMLIHKENGGLSSARNVGMDHATGEWISFVDSDDWVEPHFLQTMDELLTKSPSDLCIVGYRAVDDATKESRVWSNYRKGCGIIPKDLDALVSFIYVWARCYKHAIIKQNHLRFDERLRFCEDIPFQLDFVRFVTCYCATNEVVYNYRINRKNALTDSFVHPKSKRYVYEHMKGFCDCFGEEDLAHGLKHNQHFNRAMWDVLSSHVINLILENRYAEARRIMRAPLAREIVSTHIPRSKKDKFFIALWKGPFLGMVIISKLYYGNFEKLRNSKLVRKLS